MNTSYNTILEDVRRYLDEYSSDGYMRSRAAALAHCLTKDTDLPIYAVYDTFSCSAFERIAIALGFAVLTDEKIATMLSVLFDCPDECVTPRALCSLIFGTDSIEESCAFFAKDGILHRLFDGTKPAYNAHMTLKPFIREYLMYGESDLIRFEFSDDASVKDPHLEEVVSTVIGALMHYDGEIPVIINLNGAIGSGRKTALRAASAHCGIDFALVSGKYAADELSVLLALMNAYPVICIDGEAETLSFKELLRQLTEDNGISVVISEELLSVDIANADIICINVPLPSVAVQSEIWLRKSAGYPIADGVDFREIAMEFNLPPGAVDKALRYASMQKQNGVVLTSADIKQGCYRSVGSYMGSKAVMVNCAFSWDDLVLPAHSKKLLRTACDYVRYGCTVYEKWNFGMSLPYGRGASMIFTGPPGTGKTMAAQVVSHELGLALYKVNLASVVSKYIGETEKNLNDIFDCARRSRVVLFFDEADVLFGKRTEVKDSNDKYSNMEAAFLLQKIEEYTGVVILATNFVQNFDEAFKRRMKFLVEFPFPGKEQRSEIWKKVFPPEAPVGALDYEYLVENFEISGSNIKNIAVHSAFLAASQGDPTIEMKHIVFALKNEFAKSGKSFTRSEAGEYYRYLDE